MPVRQRKLGGELPTVGGKGQANKLNPEELQPSAGWDVFCKVIVFVFIILPLLVLLTLSILIESPIDASTIFEGLVSAPRHLEGVLEENDLLVYQGSRLLEGKLRGPESIIYRDDHLYTGTADGKVICIDLNSNELEVIATIGTPPCGSYSDEHHCGRPLGMRFDADGYLIVLDAYLGMFKINITTRDVYELFPGSMIVGGQSFHFLNDLDIASDGIIYFTDSSRFHRRNFHLDILEGKPHGRLLRYDPVANQTEVLYQGLYFANGVQLSRDESYLLIAETTRHRIQKFHLAGDNKGHMEMFIQNLPGTVDNIRDSHSGGYWIVIGMCRFSPRFDMIQTLSNKPWLRTQLAKLPLSVFTTFLPQCGMIIELDNQGNIIRSLQDLYGERLQFMSEVADHQGILYIGSFASSYIGHVNTNKKPL